MSITVTGLDEAISAIESLPSVLDRMRVFEDVSAQFKQRLTSTTPAGYSGRLQKSVLSQVDDEQGLVGYESGVETAGNPKLDSITRPRTRGRSVLWVHVADLEELVTQEAEDFGDIGVSVMESAFLEQLNARP
jgi:hypothetical protein